MFMFHISDIKKYTRCPKMFWNSQHFDQEPFIQFVRMDEAITELVMKKLEVENYFLGQRNDPHQKAMEASEQVNWLIKARFEYNDLRIKVPLMHKKEKGWDVYFILVGLFAKEEDIQYYCNNIWVLRKLGFKINDIAIVHLNKDYVRKQELDLDELFVIADSFCNAKGNPTLKITPTIKSRLQNLNPLLQEMNEVAKLTSYPAVKNRRCIRKTRCSYYPVCFKDEGELEDDSIMTLVSSQHKNDMFQQGIRLLKEAPLDLIEGSRQQYAQIMASKNGGQFIDRCALKIWMENELIYPLCFLDFEWETYAIPPYCGLSPFDVLPFEYSLHILNEDQSLQHYEYIGVQDCRKEFIERLIHDLPREGSIVAYNGEGAEKIRLLELAKQFPEYEESLIAMSKRIVDLSVPFMNGLVYDIRMRGMYSLKVLLSVFSQQYDYSDLSIHHGMDAVFKWRKLDKDENEEENIENQLMEYCGMDTFAMVLLVQWLYEQIEKR